MPRTKQSTSRRFSAFDSSRSRKPSPQKQKRQATLYDAVAGRVNSTGFIPSIPRYTPKRDTPVSSTNSMPPEEVLFRRAGAPTRYQENDVYWADRYLTEEQQLPESDLLKALHTYASDFYSRATNNKGIVDYESLDETALLAMGFLVEAWADDVLGETGHLAFVEREGEESDECDEDSDSSEEMASLSEKEEESASSSTRDTIMSSSEGPSSQSQRRKKRKLMREHDNDEGT